MGRETREYSEQRAAKTGSCSSCVWDFINFMNQTGVRDMDAVVAAAGEGGAAAAPSQQHGVPQDILAMLQQIVQCGRCRRSSSKICFNSNNRSCNKSNNFSNDGSSNSRVSGQGDLGHQPLERRRLREHLSAALGEPNVKHRA